VLSKCELAHNRGRSFQMRAGFGPALPGAMWSYFASNAGSTNGVPECIGSAMSQDRRFKTLAAAVLSILSLGGCVTSTPMDARAEVPASPKPTTYLPVENVPPRPEKPASFALGRLAVARGDQIFL
jgi:hypothetical protein